MKKNPLKVLSLEDSADDVEMIRTLLLEAGYDLSLDRAQKEMEFGSLLRSRSYDIILSDFNLSGFDAFAALRLSIEICPDVPFICFSGSIGEDAAVELLKNGAIDYVPKDRPARLPSAIQRALDEGDEKKARHRAEHALQASADRYKNLAEISPVGIFHTDDKGFTTYVNPTWCRISGLSFEEALGNGWLKAVHPEDRETVSKEWQATTLVRRASYSDYRFIRPDGEIIWVMGHAIPETNSENIVVGYLGTITDITERKQAEEVNQRAQEALRALSLRQDVILSAVPDIIMEVDNNQIYTRANQAGREFFGEDVVDKEASLYFEGDQDMHGIVQPLLKGGKNVVYVESWQRRKDGEKRLLAWWCRMLQGQNGNIIGMLSSARDITEQKSAEEALAFSELRYRRLFESAKDGILILNAGTGMIVDVNPYLVEMLGYSRSQFKGKTIWELGFLNDIIANEKKFLELQQMGYVRYEDTPLETADGRRIDVEFVSNVYEVDHQTVIQCNIRDISARKRAELEKKRIENALAESEAKYRTLVTQSPDGIFIVDLSGSFLSVSKAMWSNLKYTEEELLSMKIWDIVPSAYLALHKDRLAGIMKGEKLDNGAEYKVIGKDGVEHFIEVRSAPFAAGKEIIGYQGIARDITEQKRAEKALRESEEKYRSIFENVQDVYYEASIDGTIIDISPSIETASKGQYHRNELIGKSVNDFYPHAAERQALLTALQERGSVSDFEITLQNLDGSQIPCSISSMIHFDDQGRPVRIIGSIRDISARKRSEQVTAALYDIAKAVNASDTLQSLFDHIHETLAAVLHAENFYIALRDEGAASLTFPYEVDENPGGAPSVIAVDDAHSLTVEMMQSGKPLLLNEEELNERYASGKSRLWKTKPKCWMGVPLIMRDRAIGAMAVQDYKKSGIYTRDDVSLFSAAAQQVAIAIQRKRAEELLRNSESQLRLVWERSTEGMRLADEKGVIMSVNHAYCTMVEKPYEDLVGKPMSIVYEKSEQEGILQNHQERFRTHATPARLERDIVLWNGKRKSFSLTKTLLEIPNQPALSLSVFRDVTGQKQMEDRMRNLSRAVEQSPASIVITDTNGNIEYVNPRFTELTGYSAEEVLGKNPRVLKSGETSGEEYALMWSLILSGKEWRGEFHNKKKNGAMYWEYASISPVLDESGVATHFLAIKEDITERKEIEEKLRKSEAYYRTLIETTPDAIAIIDTQGLITYASPKAYKVFDTPVSHDIIGSSILKWVHAEQHDKVMGRLQEFLSEGVVPDIQEYHLLKFDGTPFWGEISTSPLLDAHGKVTGTLLMCRDVTEKKRLQQELLQSQKMQSIGTLAGGIAHDFNNILNIIMGYAYFLEDPKISPQKKEESLTAINNAVDRGAALVRQILTFARRSETAFGPMNLVDLFHELLSMLKQTFPKTITFKEDIGKKIPFIFADRSQIHQALLNLCVNARDAMPHGGSLTLSVTKKTGAELREQFPAAEAETYLCLGVSDTGEGMTDAVRLKIFDPFFTTKEQGKGTGLGLSVVFGVVKAHHGFIDVESKERTGTTFRLFFPAPPQSAVLQIPKNQHDLLEFEGTETILLVEDENYLREMGHLTLESQGYQVYDAQDGLQAVEMYKMHRGEIALVLTDMGLPGKTGMDVFRTLKEIDPDVKVLFMSGFIEPDAKSQLLEAGAKGFIQKPYTRQELLQRLRAALDGKE